MNARQSSVVILGGGPGGYEAALVAAHLGASVTVVDRDGVGGAAVLTDCVPSKTLISTADFMSQFETASDLGVHLEDHEGDEVSDSVAELTAVNRRILALAAAQSPRHRRPPERPTACRCWPAPVGCSHRGPSRPRCADGDAPRP